MEPNAMNSVRAYLRETARNFFREGLRNAR